jgi:protein SERAC1
MRVALSVLFRLLLPLFDRIARGWQGLRAANIVNIFSKLRNGKGLLTTLLAYAANTVSLSLSSVQGERKFCYSHKFSLSLKSNFLHCQ